MAQQPEDDAEPDTAPRAGADELEALRRDNALLKALLESASELVDVLARDGTVLRTFRARGRPLGYEPEEIEGRNIVELVHPDDVAAARAARARLVHGEQRSAQVQLRIRRRDGSWVPMECTLHDLLDDPIVVGIVVCSRDISARLALEAKLRMAQRMESVGRLASGIVHDFNNLLAVIALAAARARAAAQAGNPAQGIEALDEIARAAERGTSLTKRLLSFVRDRPVRLRRVDLAALVGAHRGTLASLLPDDVQLELVSGTTELPVLADPAELEHVLLNLVLNARDALPDGGVIRVEARAEADGEARAVLEVQDNGSGIDESVQDRLFEPFFTTKSAERGTGLGLWTVQEVVGRYGGSIEVVSAPGQGTTVRVRLPLSAAAQPSEVPPARGAASPARPLRILLADDEPRLLELLGAALREEGHEVYTARDGFEALDHVTRGVRPDVLVTDVSMPRLGGRQLARKLRESLPELPVLLVSGYSDPQEDAPEPNTALLSKPFAAQELLEAIAGLLRSA